MLQGKDDISPSPRLHRLLPGVPFGNNRLFGDNIFMRAEPVKPLSLYRLQKQDVPRKGPPLFRRPALRPPRKKRSAGVFLREM